MLWGAARTVLIRVMPKPASLFWGSYYALFFGSAGRLAALDDGVDYDGASLCGGGGRARLCRLPQAQCGAGAGWENEGGGHQFFPAISAFRRDSAVFS